MLFNGDSGKNQLKNSIKNKKKREREGKGREGKGREGKEKYTNLLETYCLRISKCSLPLPTRLRPWSKEVTTPGDLVSSDVRRSPGLLIVTRLVVPPTKPQPLEHSRLHMLAPSLLNHQPA